MLDLFKINSIDKENNVNYSEHKAKSLKHFPSSTREWDNSIYSYTNPNINSLPVATITATKLLKSFLTLFNNLIERKIRTKKMYYKLSKLSSNRIYISNGQFKHTNNKVIITLFLFNRQKQNYLFSLRRKYINTFFNVRGNKKNKFKYSFIKKLRTIQNRSLSNMKFVNKEKYALINNNIYKNKYGDISQYIDNYYSKFINKSFKKLKLYFMYRQIFFLNKSKYNYNLLQYIKRPLCELFNKNVEFNLVDLKRFYLNSDIISESILLKLTNNRRKILRYLTKLRNKVKTHEKTVFSSRSSLSNEFNNIYSDGKQVISNLKYKNVSGFRIEAKGRLSKRYTASRSISKTKYKGNLLNIDSSFKGLSSVLLKGNLKSNLENTKLRSKSRIGSFGIKGWLSGS